MLAVVIIVIAVIALLVAWRVRYAVSIATGKTAGEVLTILGQARKPMNVSEIMKATGRNSGFVITALKFLHKRELISSTQSVNNVEAATDSARYAISSKGRKVLKES